VYTSDNVYDYVTLPSDMKFKFSFDINRWEEYFDWISLPSDWDKKNTNTQHNKSKVTFEDDKSKMREEERKRMSSEIDTLLHRERKPLENTDENNSSARKKSRIGKLPDYTKELYNDQ
jgi:hypothetical protein